MTLSEKIIYCRKRAGLSQEALAEQLGVSRQAVGKWESGDAVPETGKLPVLARVFGVSIDWLLSEEDPEPQPNGSEGKTGPGADGPVDALGKLPGFLGGLIRRYGWLYGVYQAVFGLVVCLAGTLMVSMGRRAAQTAGQVFANLYGGSPFELMGGFLIAVGALIVLAGAALAVLLRRHGRK